MSITFYPNLEPIDQGTNWSKGDKVWVFPSSAPAATKAAVKSGTASKPDETYAPVFEISRTINVPESSFAGDGEGGLAALRVCTLAQATSEGQAIGIAAGAVTFSSHESGHSLADGIAITAVGIAKGESTRTGMAIFANGRRETATGRAVGMEVTADNETESAGTFNPNGPSSTMGIHLHPTGTSDSGCGLQLGHPNSAHWEVGIGIPKEAITASSFRDKSSSAVSVDIQGSHATASLNVASAAGTVLFNGNAVNFGNGFSQFLERETPTAPGENTARMYLKDNGGGKSQLAILFSSGAEQIIATQP